MDSSSMKKRDLLAPIGGVNKRVSSWWPIYAFLIVIVTLLNTYLIRIKKIIVYLFQQKKSVKGKVILVTGAGRGLGRGLSVKLAALGAHVACLDINAQNNEETVHLIREQGGVAYAFTCNVANSQQVKQMKKDVTEKMGQVDILVNNAALIIAMKVDEIDYDDIRAMFEVNAMGPAFMTKAFLPEMMERNSGHIVTISSVGAWASTIYLSMYCSTKAAVTRYFESIRVELEDNKKNNIVVTVVHPFFINTSADYTDWFKAPFPILTENYVCESIVDAILYEKDSVTVPPPLSILKLIDALGPSYQYNIFNRYLPHEFNLPNKKMREELPYTSVVENVIKSK